MRLWYFHCPVCFQEVKEHRVQNLIDCIEKFSNQYKDDIENGDPVTKVQRKIAKTQESLEITDLLLYSPYLARYESYLRNQIMFKGQGNPENLLKVLKDFFGDNFKDTFLT